MTRYGTLLLGLGLTVACTSALDVGNDDGDSALMDGAGGGPPIPPDGDPLPSWPELRTCPEPTGSPFEGTWEGAVETFLLEPILPVRLVIESASRDRVCGRLTWDTEASPPPDAVDPDAVYIDEMLDVGINDGDMPVFEGVTYAIAEGAARDATLRFAVATAEPWQSWCELQTPVYNTRREIWSCLPADHGWGSNKSQNVCRIGQESGPELVVSYTKCAACYSRFCVCNSTSCTANPSPSQPFDFTLDDSGSTRVLTAPGIGEPYGGELEIRLEHIE
jgi:hypothetical protein